MKTPANFRPPIFNKQRAKVRRSNIMFVARTTSYVLPSRIKTPARYASYYKAKYALDHLLYDMSTHLHPAKPVPVPIPSSEVTTYDTKIKWQL